MCLLFESIKVEHKKLNNLEAHLERMNTSVLKLWGSQALFTESDIVLPNYLTNDLYKCRIIYDKKIHSIDFYPYLKRKINTVKMVELNDLDYSFKYYDRRNFENLKTTYPAFDEFIILQNGKVTDSTFSNLAFFNGTEWHTPDTYLLKGTKRDYLIRKKLIKEIQIRSGEINNYQLVCFINAMLDPGDLILSTSDIH